MPTSRAGFLLAGLLAAVNSGQAQIMSVDLGHEFFKVALMRQGVPLEIVLNDHSKRKTTSAVSYFDNIRTFGDDALAHQGKAPAKVPMFFHSLLGQNFTSDDIVAGGSFWEKFGLGDKFYSFKLDYDADRGVPQFQVGGENASSGEEVLAAILSHAKTQAETSADGKPVKDCVITVPPDASLRYRQAVAAAAEIAGLRLLTLVHEGSGFAVQRAVDYMPEKGASELILFYNLGSRKTEASIVRFESRQAGMVAGKTAPVVTVLGSAVDFTIGGHLMDLKIAHAMLKQFQAKHPKLAEGIEKSPRALRKLLAQSQKTKMVLSSNKVAPFTCESLYEDTDFQSSIKREDFEEMCKDMFDKLTSPIETALKAANATLDDIHFIEVVGGAWRVPKIQTILNEYVASNTQKKLPLGQHLNGEEAAALGAALIAANSSSSFRVKKIFFSDITTHEYAVQVVSLTGEWEKNVTVLYPAGAPLGGKKKLTFTLEEDFAIKIFEDGILVTEYTVSGLADLLANGKWKDYNRTGPPKISTTVQLEGSGIIEVKTPTATVEEAYWVNITKPKAKNVTNSSSVTNGTNDTNGTNESDATQEDPKEEAPKEDAPKEEAPKEEAPKEEAPQEDAPQEDAPKEAKEEEASTEEEEAGVADANATNATDNQTNNTEDFEIIQKLKKKKHDKKLTLTHIDYPPKPLTDEQIKEKRLLMETVFQAEQEILAVAGMKNELESSIYGSRDKLEREDFIKISTEEQREAVTKLCTEYEEWMYEPGSTKKDYETRLMTLRDLVEPMEERAMELESRADIPDMVKDGIDDMKKTQEHIEKNMTWVNASKLEKAVEKLTEFEAWWQKKQDSQAQLPLHEAPAYTKKRVVDKLAKVQKEFDTLKKIKKPKEAKPPKVSKNKTNATDANKTTAKKEEQLPKDADETEKELQSVREKKANAVENEDFDMAHSLKQREQLLVKHLEELKAAKSEL